VEQLSAGSGTECIEAGLESALELIGSHQVSAFALLRWRV